MKPINDEFYMRMALDLAAGTLGQTGVNPSVGCVIVQAGAVVGIGAHLRRGSHHAEVHALQMAGAAAKGATAYVTLEPCSHFGKTPPCCDALLAAGVRRVVIACLDPNPQVAGRGVAQLLRNGLDIELGVLQSAAQQLNEVFFKYILTGMPFVAVKSAATLDGKLSTSSGHSHWVTGEEARRYVQQLRHRYAAVMTGIETVLADDPLLTVRTEVPGLPAVRIVADSRLRTPLDARIVSTCSVEAPVILLTTEQADTNKADALRACGVEIISCGSGPRVDLRLALQRLGQREISSILLEAGGTLNGALLAAGLIDKAYLFFAPKIIGGSGVSNFQFAGFATMDEAIRLERTSVERIGDDFLMSGYVARAT